MMFGKQVTVVMPAYHAAATLAQTVAAIPAGVVDSLVVVDDASTDDTVDVARRLGLSPVVHAQNRGYGGNQKTCYQTALSMGADVVIMLHPDLQYDPRLIPSMASLIALERYDVVLGTRMGGRGPRVGGMPSHKWLANRLLTRVENAATGMNLSEYHTGYRAYSRAALEAIPWQRNSEGFLFDNQLLLQAIDLGLEIGEVSCPAHYPPEASSIALGPAIRYGLGVLSLSVQYPFHRWGIRRMSILEPDQL